MGSKLHSFPIYLYLLSLLLLVEGAQERYGGCMVERANVETQIQLEAISASRLDVWSCEGVLAIGYNDIRVKDADVMKLYANNTKQETLINDIQNEIDRETEEQNQKEEPFNINSETWFTRYRNYSYIVRFLKNEAKEHSSVVSYQSIGKTYGGNDIPLVKVTGPSKGSKHKVIVVGSLQARDWIAPATVAYITRKLATLYSYNETVTALLDKVEVHLIPVANPDGYEYSRTTSRLWRNNRRPNADGSYGVDLNKNWNSSAWAKQCTSPPSSPIFCGTKPFSEKETASIRDYVFSKGPFNGAVGYSSYGQQVVRPFGTSEQSEAGKIGRAWASAISSVNSVTYTSLAASAVTSTSRDWLCSFAGIPLSFTVALRDKCSGYGFLLPPSQIIATGQENFEGFITFLQAVAAQIA